MAAVAPLASSTYSAGDPEQMNRVYDRLTADEARHPVPRHYLVGGDDEEPIELPQEIYEVLRRVVDAMRQGLSVTISPTSQTLTTQQAADLLGISRPTLIRALDEGKLPYTRTGSSHRRLALTDVLDYREQRRAAQYAALERLSVDDDDTADVDEELRELKESRKAVAARRRKSRSS